MRVVDAVDGGRGVLELLGGFAEALGQLGQLGRAEQEHDDGENDDEFSRSKIHDDGLSAVKGRCAAWREPGGAPVTGLWLLAGADLLDGGPDAEVRPAAAQVPAHRFVDVGVGRVRVLVEQGHGLHDLAGLAVPALGHVVVDPGLLDGVQLVTLGETIDGRDVLALDGAHGRDARPLGYTVDVAGAGAAEAQAAAVLQALDVHPVTQDPEQFLVVVGVDGDRVAIEVEGNRRHIDQAPYSLSGKLRGCLPVARAQALAAAPAAAGTPSSPTPPGVTLDVGRMWTLMSGVESNIRVHL